jgi:hypothetical protein
MTSIKLLEHKLHELSWKDINKDQHNKYIPQDWNSICYKDEIFLMDSNSFDNMINIENYWTRAPKRNNGKYGSIPNA